jgi:hypothetical protein
MAKRIRHVALVPKGEEYQGLSNTYLLCVSVAGLGKKFRKRSVSVLRLVERDDTINALQRIRLVPAGSMR